MPTFREENYIEASTLQTSSIYPIRLRGRPDWKAILSHIAFEGKLKKLDLVKLIYQVRELLLAEPNVLTQLKGPTIVVGSLHGQLNDLLLIFQANGPPIGLKYVFLGNYINRGFHSVELLIFLFALKCIFPESVVLLRGSHQCRAMACYFNFKKQCLRKYDLEIFQLFISSFEALPLCAVLDGKFFLVHSGMPCNGEGLQDIQSLERRRQPPLFGLFCDLLWADPSQSVLYLKENQFRNCSFSYGCNPLRKFLDRHKLLSVVRTHQVSEEGYQFFRSQFSSSLNQFPPLITVFSASNYCQAFGNKGAVMRVCGTALDIQQHSDIRRPFLLSDFSNAIQWSFPFIFSAVGLIFERLMSVLAGHKKGNTPSFRKKLKLVAKTNLHYNLLVQRSLMFIKFGGTSPDERFLSGVSKTMTKEQIISQASRINAANQRRITALD